MDIVRRRGPAGIGGWKMVEIGIANRYFSA
jgi:hypothetical protein